MSQTGTTRASFFPGGQPPRPPDRKPTPEELHEAGGRGRFVLFRLVT